MSQRFHKLLIANRGEIAVRIATTARALAYRTVAVFSEADAGAAHVAACDEAVCIGPAPVRESYLDIDRLLDAARRTGADAIHPGYGFLSEKAEFARRCADAGIVFVGPPAEAIAVMGDKAVAKRRMIDAKVPCVPGYQGAGQDDSQLAIEAGRVGFPLLVKAAAGGGGRGMRIVREAAALPGAISSARSEAINAFGDGALLLERLVEGARHIEIQVFADTHGNVVHLGERECSVQRRHQKIIEECPSPVVSAELRARLGAAAIEAAKAIGYVGAGTVEFLLATDGSFYFLEMNTRLQVEHPVTECVTGLDLVALQLHVAQGAPLPFGQSDVVMRGHAIEARVYAEDPYHDFLPQTGRVTHWQPARGEGIRIDAGIREQQAISAFYDPMIAKVIAFGEDRELARRRLMRAIEDTVLLGPVTNCGYLLELLRDEDFVQARFTTSTIDARVAASALVRPAVPRDAWSLAAVLSCATEGFGPAPDRESTARFDGPMAWPLTLACASERQSMLVRRVGWRGFGVEIEGTGAATHVTVLSWEAPCLRVEIDGVRRTLHAKADEEGITLSIAGQAYVFEEPAPGKRGAQATGDGRICAPMSGRLLAVHVSDGERVERGQCVAVLEAMKMEHQILAAGPGVVVKVHGRAGDQIAARRLLVEIELDGDNPSEHRA